MRNVYFHHFHKCAGTSVIKWLDKNFPTHINNINGNELDELGVAVPLHLLKVEELEEYFIQRKECSWLAYEWGLPDLAVTNKHRYTVTVIREPRERLISNYRFDYTNKATSLKFSEYVSNVGIPFWYHNFYKAEFLRERNIFEEFNEGKDLSKCVYDNFHEIWLLEKGEFKKVKGEGVLENAFARLEKHNSKRKSFFREPKFDVDIQELCNEDVSLYQEIKNILK